MSLKVKYLDVPNGAQETAQVEGQGQSFSVAAKLSTGTESRAYATLEPVGWPLDGGRDILPDNPEDLWWSAESSDNDGYFANPPVITILLPEVHTATGLTFTFSPATEEWCSEIRVSWYNDTVLLMEASAFPDAPLWILQKAAEGFNKIRIELIRTNNPNSFAKLQLVEIGQTVWVAQGELTGVHLVNEVDPTLSELTVDTMTVRIRDKQNRQLLPQKNQRVELYRNEKMIAQQYITESSREEQSSYTFNCQSVIGLLENEYLGGIYTAKPAEELFADILDGFSYVLSASFTGSKVTGYLPICTRREALQQLVFALGAVVTTHGDGVIHIDPIPQTVSGRFSTQELFLGAKTETAPRVAKVEVVAHSYSPSSEVDTLLDAELISGEDVMITFTEPHHSYTITGGTITGSGANWVTVTANAEVTLTGKKYIHSTTHHTRRNPAATVSERNNTHIVESATLIHRGNVAPVLERLYGIAQLRQTLSQKAVITSQTAGHYVTSEGEGGMQIRGFITSMESDLTPYGHTASITILGMEVPAQIAQFYSGELFAGEEVEHLCS